MQFTIDLDKKNIESIFCLFCIFTSLVLPCVLFISAWSKREATTKNKQINLLDLLEEKN